jgi:hypothetical protein
VSGTGIFAAILAMAEIETLEFTCYFEADFAA